MSVLNALGEVPWGKLWPTITVLLGLFGLDKLKKRAEDFEHELVATARKNARLFALMVKDGVLDAVHAMNRWEARLETWLAENGKKKLPPALYDKALRAAHEVFDELHLYIPPDMKKALDQLSTAAGSFEVVLEGELGKKIERLEKLNARLAGQ